MERKEKIRREKEKQAKQKEREFETREGVKIGFVSPVRYEQFKRKFKAIHDEYTDSDSFQRWEAAKEGWEATETYRKEPYRYAMPQFTYHPVSFLWIFYKTQPLVKERYSCDEEDWKVYSKLFMHSHSKDLRCPKFSSAQEKFDLKRKLLLIEYGLPSDTKLPCEWYKYGYEWDWS